MTPIQHLTVCASEEAGEVAELAFELGKTSLKLSKDLHKALRFGLTDVDPATGLTKIEMLVNEIIDLKACIELLQEIGVPLFGLDDRDKIEAKKKKVMKYMAIAKELGTVKQDIIPVKTKSRPLTAFERNKAICCLTEIYNPIRQKEYGQQLYEYIVEKIKEQAMPDGVGVMLTDKFCDELLIFKDQLIKDLITGHKYYTILNKNFMDMIDVKLIAEIDKITIQPNSVLEVLMNGAAQVTFFVGDNSDNIEELWEKHKHEFEN